MPRSSPDAFKRLGGPLELLQLWVNLPPRLKMTPPRYTGLQAERSRHHRRDRPHREPGLRNWGGQNGPIASLTGVFMSTSS